ncbi:MAG: hypothetical protein U0271_39100 [Polyangiaceae bacterium]
MSYVRLVDVRAATLLLASSLSACSLDGLADGEPAGGQGGLTSSSSTGGATAGGAGGVGNSGGAGGAGGAGTGGVGGAEPDAFSWIKSVGNDGIQETSAGASSLRVAPTSADGSVWIAASTVGAVDPDDAGPYPLTGGPSANLLLLRYTADGSLVAFHGFEAAVSDLPGVLVVEGVSPRPGGGAIVVGTLKTGTLYLSDDHVAGPALTQAGSTNDAFVLAVDATGALEWARQLGGSAAGHGQNARAAIVDGARVLVTGNFKKSLRVVDPLTNTTEATCSQTATAEAFERAFVLELGEVGGVCARVVTLTGDIGTNTSASMQGSAIWAGPSAIFVGGSFTQEIVLTPNNLVAVARDGFVAAFDPALATSVPLWIFRVSGDSAGGTDAIRALASDGASTLWIGGEVERGTTDPAPEIVVNDAVPCKLTAADGRDGLIAAIEPSTGACVAAATAGGTTSDEVIAFAHSSAQGLVACGYTDHGMALIDGAAPGSPSGFLLRFALSPQGGLYVGGPSYTSCEGLSALSTGAFLVAGAYGKPFSALTRSDDFFVGALTLP